MPKSATRKFQIIFHCDFWPLCLTQKYKSILVKNRNFGQRFNFFWKIAIFGQISKFRHKFSYTPAVHLTDFWASKNGVYRGNFAALVLRNSLRCCELGTSYETVEYPITIIDITKSCKEAKIDFSESSLDSTLDLLVRSGFFRKDGGSYTVRIRDIIERMTTDSGT